MILGRPRGPLVAVLDESDQNHAWCSDVLKTLRPPLLTTEAVVTEAFYLLANLQPAQERLCQWLHEGWISIEPLDDPGRCSQAPKPALEVTAPGPSGG